ncbi:MAG: hypothetical protein JW772_01955 [Candidatus Diapherotrites archaeon]|nr:hypothetical protein [Candidatus Diapherotrites archaeon]
MKLFLIVLLVFVVALSGCATGCAGKHSITNLKVEPSSPCLETYVNNCNGGVLTLTNHCGEVVMIGDFEVLPRDETEEGKYRSYSIELVRDETGAVRVEKTKGNYAAYLPDYDFLEIDGFIGDKKITLSYVKAKNRIQLPI